jgi:hypothetical protein
LIGCRSMYFIAFQPAKPFNGVIFFKVDPLLGSKDAGAPAQGHAYPATYHCKYMVRKVLHWDAT